MAQAGATQDSFELQDAQLAFGAHHHSESERTDHE